MWVAVSVGRRHEGCEGKSGGGERNKLDAGMECTEVVDTAGGSPLYRTYGSCPYIVPQCRRSPRSGV